MSDFHPLYDFQDDDTATDSRSVTLRRIHARDLSAFHLGTVVWPQGHTPGGLSDYTRKRDRFGRERITLYIGGNTITVKGSHVITIEEN